MSKHKVLLLGATGETGGDVLTGLLEDNTFAVSLLVQPSSADKSANQAFKERGLPIIIGDLNGSVDELSKVISGFQTVISTIGAADQKTQLTLVEACALAKTPRFIPCGFTTVCPPGGVMSLRDDKEVVYQRILREKVPYTIIDVGYWHQISFPKLASGKIDYATLVPRNDVFHDGEAKTLLTDKRDMGRFVARIIKDSRTLNQKVFTYSDSLSQNEIIALLEEKSGEKVETTRVSASELLARRDQARKDYEAVNEDPTFWMKRMMRSQTEYQVSKYLRKDNTVDNAKYLGYLNARELYPDFQPIKFEQLLDEVLAGKGQRPYVGRF
ncbi:isoflavone reductase family protein [Lophiotrema nucula]|uniref:Isoflavone reductase family protein n=1 Tax=Lophiotrema nucula TaxID=690887 RepID=A0A6A5Z078_9PLEO|nr:isoflavone reductase family protein [Lophiotrema nucula]